MYDVRTVHPDTCWRLAARAAAAGAHVVDAPVSGGSPAAEAGRLLVMAGGDDAVVARCLLAAARDALARMKAPVRQIRRR